MRSTAAAATCAASRNATIGATIGHNEKPWPVTDQPEAAYRISTTRSCGDNPPHTPYSSRPEIA